MDDAHLHTTWQRKDTGVMLAGVVELKIAFKNGDADHHVIDMPLHTASHLLDLIMQASADVTLHDALRGYPKPAPE